MAITLVSRPTDYGRVNDSNRLNYTFTSTNYLMSNFNFQFQLRKWNIDGTSTDIGTFNLYPSSTGSAIFNPSQIYKNYVSYDFNASKTGLEPANNSFSQFELAVYEYYGNPPIRQTGSTQKWIGELPISPYQAPPMYYNGCQQFVPYDYIPLNPDGNRKWVMSGATSGQFLTDAPNYQLDNDDLAFLYFIGAPLVGRPTRIRYTLYYRSIIGGSTPEPEPEPELNIPSFLGISKDIWSNANNQQAAIAAGNDIKLDRYIPPVIQTRSGITAVIIYDTNVNYSSVNERMWYFPMGPYQLFNYGIFNSSYLINWVYYKVDIMNVNTVLNHTPFYVYRQEKCNKYGKVMLSWLNPHGGFDNYTFDKKIDSNIKIKKQTYKKRLPANYSPYDAGERVFSVDSVETLTLRTSLLTQVESQLLTQLVQSPKVYMIKIYDYNGAKYPYSVPVIVEQEEFRYEQKVNDKEIFTEIKIRYANDKIIQRD